MKDWARGEVCIDSNSTVVCGQVAVGSGEHQSSGRYMKSENHTVNLKL